MGWTYFNAQQWLKWKETLKHEGDFPDKQPIVCKYFGCPVHLTPFESLCGPYCVQHSIIKNESRPCGDQDPVKFVSY